jgi:ParB family chromosome partitioning protein
MPRNRQAKPTATTQRQALGRGLNALLPQRSGSVAKKTGDDSAQQQMRQVPLKLVDPNPYQPRRIFREQAIEELAQSIRVDGLIQPIVVQRQGTRYTLVVGERRFRAAKLAGLAEIPAIVQDIAQDRVLEVTLVENIQREDLNPIEVAHALRTMTQELGLSHEELAERTGKDRTTITNLLRLLRLPSDIQQLVAERRLSMGHARALLALDGADQHRALAEKTAAQGLSVRQVERFVRNLVEPRAQKSESPPDPNVEAAVKRLEEVLSTRVKLIIRGRDRGKIEIEFYSAEDLDRIYETIVGPEES